MSYPYDAPTLLRIRVPQPGGRVPPRPDPRAAHPPETVALVRRLMETTLKGHRQIAFEAGVDKGTVSRWWAKYGWVRRPGADRRAPRDATRYRPNLVGRALATRLRIQAERLVAEIETAENVDPEALGEALRLLAQARAEQQVRRRRKFRPPLPEEVAAALAEKAAAKQAERDQRRFVAAHFRRTR